MSAVIVPRVMTIDTRDEGGRRIGRCPDGTEFTIEKMNRAAQPWRCRLLDTSAPGSYGYVMRFAQDADTREELLDALTRALGYQAWEFTEWNG